MLYARHLAWLNATPEEAKKSRRDSLLEGGEGSPFLIMPPVDDLEYIIHLWHDAGTVGSNGMGISRLSWQEIKAWLDIREMNDELPLESWEVDLVRDLSAEYSSEYSQASEKDRPAPYAVEDIEEVDRLAISHKIKNVLGGFKKSKQEPRYIEEGD